MMEGTGANMDSILDLDYGITGYGISSSETKLDSLLLRKELILKEFFFVSFFEVELCSAGDFEVFSFHL